MVTQDVACLSDNGLFSLSWKILWQTAFLLLSLSTVTKHLILALFWSLKEKNIHRKSIDIKSHWKPTIHTVATEYIVACGARGLVGQINCPKHIDNRLYAESKMQDWLPGVGGITCIFNNFKLYSKLFKIVGMLVKLPPKMMRTVFSISDSLLFILFVKYSNLTNN